MYNVVLETMDNSTDGVTVKAYFVVAIIDLYKEKVSIYPILERIISEVDLSNPENMIPIATYNKLCNWIERKLGSSSVKISGKSVGQAAYKGLIDNKMITADDEPIKVMEALVIFASMVINDPKNRGWEIVESKNKSIVMRRTQTFNSALQFGVLEGLLHKCKGIYSPRIELVKEVKNGDEFDEYLLTWS